jgi:hypothetical protein
MKKGGYYEGKKNLVEGVSLCFSLCVRVLHGVSR